MRAASIMLLCILVSVLTSCDSNTDMQGEPVVYVSGYVRATTGVRIPCYWRNGERIELSRLDDTKDGNAYSIFADGDTTYACGFTTDSSSILTPAYWVNGIRHDITSFDSNRYGKFNVIKHFGMIVYLGGATKVSGVQVPCYWEGASKHSLPVLSSSRNGYVEDLFMENNEILACGVTMNDAGKNIACFWMGDTRVDLGNAGQESYAYRIIPYGNAVIFVGYETDSNGVRQACYWEKNGTKTIVSTENAVDQELVGYYANSAGTLAYGTQTEVSGGMIPIAWKNGVVQPLSYQGGGGWINGIVYNGGIAYACGATGSDFTTGVSRPCVWQDGVREDLSVPDITQSGNAVGVFITE